MSMTRIRRVQGYWRVQSPSRLPRRFTSFTDAIQWADKVTATPVDHPRLTAYLDGELSAWIDEGLRRRWEPPC